MSNPIQRERKYFKIDFKKISHGLVVCKRLLCITFVCTNHEQSFESRFQTAISIIPYHCLPKYKVWPRDQYILIEASMPQWERQRFMTKSKKSSALHSVITSWLSKLIDYEANARCSVRKSRPHRHAALIFLDLLPLRSVGCDQAVIILQSNSVVRKPLTLHLNNSAVLPLASKSNDDTNNSVPTCLGCAVSCRKETPWWSCTH